MSTFRRKAISVVLFSVLVVCLLYTLIVITFFTNDEVIKYTDEKVPTLSIRCEQLIRPEEDLSVEDTAETEVVTSQETNLPANYGNKEKTSTEVSSRSTIIIGADKNKETPETPKESPKTNTSTTTTTQTNNSTKTTNSAPQNSVSTQSNYNGYNSVGRVEIPKTGVDLPILSDISVGGMEIGACVIYSTGSLNKTGNTLISTHNYMNGKLFSNNYKLQIGDVIYITSLDGKKIKYVIYDKFITTPQDLSYIKRNSGSEPGIALSCCTDDEVNRIVILAKSEM